ncbi:cytochrome c [Acidiphilium sp. AL]|uniref:c-type cytochrome n=1 Tax=Acidiphilium sp. AL TaxID=2871704 RepID=UPI0021CB7342|nr:cytochrome c [Acidiphilium sp. AL]MCU4162272.1 cytochrome c [Acidiphilium sp. AL]
MVAFLASGGNFILAAPANAAGHALKNPIIRKPEAIKAGRALYAEHCMICHGQKGGRGPDLFENALTDQEFLTTAMEGKSGNRGQMPSWAGVLSVKQIWEIEAFVKSRPRF